MSTDPRWQREWFNRISDLVTHYHPDLLYSDSQLPFDNEVGSGLVANFYNDNIAANHGQPGRLQLQGTERGEWVQDLERGVQDKIDPNPWQTDTSNGDWFYRKRSLQKLRPSHGHAGGYREQKWKSAAQCRA